MGTQEQINRFCHETVLGRLLTYTSAHFLGFAHHLYGDGKMRNSWKFMTKYCWKQQGLSDRSPRAYTRRAGTSPSDANAISEPIGTPVNIDELGEVATLSIRRRALIWHLRKPCNSCRSGRNPAQLWFKPNTHVEHRNIYPARILIVSGSDKEYYADTWID